MKNTNPCIDLSIFNGHTNFPWRWEIYNKYSELVSDNYGTFSTNNSNQLIKLHPTNILKTNEWIPSIPDALLIENIPKLIDNLRTIQDQDNELILTLIIEDKICIDTENCILKINDTFEIFNIKLIDKSIILTPDIRERLKNI